MKKEDEWIPWYRRKDYKGNLSEGEKRHLDSFRTNERHPAAAYHDLPDEVQSHICEIEMALYDHKQEIAVNKAFGLTGVGAFLIFASYQSLTWVGSTLGYILGAGVVVFAWFNYSRDWSKNAEGLWIRDRGPGAPFSRTQEAIQINWELAEINRLRDRKKHGVQLERNLDHN